MDEGAVQSRISVFGCPFSCLITLLNQGFNKEKEYLESREYVFLAAPFFLLKWLSSSSHSRNTVCRFHELVPAKRNEARCDFFS